MGKVLKILVSFVLLPLSIGALVLAIMVYGKREQVILRNQILAEGYVKLAPTFEDKPGDPPTEARSNPDRDISPATAEFIAKAPDVSDFWAKKYAPAIPLELDAKSMYDLSSRKGELLNLYKKDGLQQIQKDSYGNPVMEGEGTINGVITEMVKKSSDQLTKLKDTRQMLTIVRDELVETIIDLNKVKAESRKRAKEIEALAAERDAAKAEAETEKGKAAAAVEAKKTAEAKAEDMQKQRDDLNTKYEDQNIEVKNLQKKNKELQDIVNANAGVSAGTPDTEAFKGSPGDKGKVVALNAKWNYVLVELDEAFLKEAMGDDYAATPPPKPAPNGVIMSVKRTSGGKDIFVGKLRVIRINAKQKHAIGDILTEWKQKDIKEGDILFFP